MCCVCLLHLFPTYIIFFFSHIYHEHLLLFLLLHFFVVCILHLLLRCSYSSQVNLYFDGCRMWSAEGLTCLCSSTWILQWQKLSSSLKINIIREEMLSVSRVLASPWDTKAFHTKPVFFAVLLGFVALKFPTDKNHLTNSSILSQNYCVFQPAWYQDFPRTYIWYKQPTKSYSEKVHL